MADPIATDLRLITAKMHLDTAKALLEDAPQAGEAKGYVDRRHADAEWHILRAKLLMAYGEVLDA